MGEPAIELEDGVNKEESNIQCASVWEALPQPICLEPSESTPPDDAHAQVRERM